MRDETLPPADAIRALLANRSFLSRIADAGTLDLEATLDVTDDDFAAFDALFAAHGQEAADDDDDLVTRTLSIPIYFPAGFTWQVEHFDNSEDAGVVHRLWSAAASEPLTLAVRDAHPRGPALRGSELLELARAARTEPRNVASGVADVAVLLLWSATGVSPPDDVAAIEHQLAEAWIATGAVAGDVAATIAAASTRKRTSSWRPHPTRGWVALAEGAFRGAGAVDPEDRDAWDDAAFGTFNHLLDVARAAT